MILGGTLPDHPARPWRAAAAADADRVATTQQQFVDATRHSGVREALAMLRGARKFSNYPTADRRVDVARFLAASVEKQARHSGLGRVQIVELVK